MGFEIVRLDHVQLAMPPGREDGGGGLLRRPSRLRRGCPSPSPSPRAAAAGSPGVATRCTSASRRTSARPARPTRPSWSAGCPPSSAALEAAGVGGAAEPRRRAGAGGVRGRPVREPDRADRGGVSGRSSCCGWRRGTSERRAPTGAASGSAAPVGGIGGESGDLPIHRGYLQCAPAGWVRRWGSLRSREEKGCAARVARPSRIAALREWSRPLAMGSGPPSTANTRGPGQGGGRVDPRLRDGELDSRQARETESVVGRGDGGQVHRHAGTAGGVVLGHDRAALALDHLGDDGQAQARAGQPTGGRRAVEAVEDVREVLPPRSPDRGRAPRPTPSRHRTDTDCARRAPLARVVEQVAHGAARAGRDAPRPSTARRRARTSPPWPARACSAPPTASRTSRSRRSASGRGWLLVPAASSARSPTRSVSSWSCTSTSSTSTLRSSSLSSSTRRITSRLVRRLVSGVRSSWEASRTSWLWARREDSSASSRRLKVRRRRPSSSGPPGESRRDTSVVSATSSTVWVSELSGTERGAGRRASRGATASSRPMRATAPRSRASFLSSERGVEQRCDLQRPAVDEDARRRACRRAGARRTRAARSRRR